MAAASGVGFGIRLTKRSHGRASDAKDKGIPTTYSTPFVQDGGEEWTSSHASANTSLYYTYSADTGTNSATPHATASKKKKRGKDKTNRPSSLGVDASEASPAANLAPAYGTAVFPLCNSQVAKSRELTVPPSTSSDGPAGYKTSRETRSFSTCSGCEEMASRPVAAKTCRHPFCVGYVLIV